MSQILTTKAYGPITFLRTWASNGRQLGELPNGTFARTDGNPIQSTDEIYELIPDGPVRERALAWWEHREEASEAVEAPDVVFRGGAVIYAETGEPLSSFEAILAAFPEPGPFQTAALEWFGNRQARQRALAPNDMGIQAGTGLMDGPGSSEENPAVQEPEKKPRVYFGKYEARKDKEQEKPRSHHSKDKGY